MGLFEGVGGKRRPPPPERRYEVLDRDTRGYSITYRVKDERGDEWNVKIGPEAQPEVVASQLVRALGYHQLNDGFVRFAFRGRHQELVARVGVDDVKWTGERLLRISDREWRDAFQAGGYDQATARRFVARIQQKAEEGLALR